MYVSSWFSNGCSGLGIGIFFALLLFVFCCRKQIPAKAASDCLPQISGDVWQIGELLEDWRAGRRKGGARASFLLFSALRGVLTVALSSTDNSYFGPETIKEVPLL